MEILQEYLKNDTNFIDTLIDTTPITSSIDPLFIVRVNHKYELDFINVPNHTLVYVLDESRMYIKLSENSDWVGVCTSTLDENI